MLLNNEKKTNLDNYKKFKQWTQETIGIVVN